jgi:methylthioribose-1-phosphate isomerase
VSSRARARARARAGVEPIEWVGGPGGCLRLLDQTLLPGKVRYLRLRDAGGVAAAIRRLAVRGAPAIGVAAAYGVVLGARAAPAGGPPAFRRHLDRVLEQLAGSRPTAVNLFWALERMRKLAEGLPPRLSRRELCERLLAEARAIHEEDERLCRAIGDHGAALLESGWSVMTHCNAGLLATGGMGTALAVIYRASAAGKRLEVIAGETRPLLQGARLTSWELRQAGIEVTLICDSAAASVMRKGRVQCVVVGADRIARNGDVANKIGTYALAVLAREHEIPFYVAAPSTTFDPRARSAADIPIEERSAEEVTAPFGRRTAPPGVAVYNPAFDITPARLVTAFITEQGVIGPPFGRAIRRVLGGAP